MAKNALLTIAIGDHSQAVAKLTHPLMKAYAERIGAGFVLIDRPGIAVTTPHFEKFQIFNLLCQYRRILYIDADIIIRPDCPNLFDIVPEDRLGAFNEGPFVDRIDAIHQVVKQYNVDVEPGDKRYYTQYYNTGVMVVSRPHRHLFQKPEVEASNFFEQSYLNLQFLRTKTPMHDLAYYYNRMSCMDLLTGEPRLASYVVHYAGYPGAPDALLGLIRKDLEQWDRDAPKYAYKRNILIKVHGGLGDEVCAEPVIRYIIEKAYPDARVQIETWFPRLFKHLTAKIHEMGKFELEFDTPYYLMETMVSPDSLAWKYVSANLAHTTDFASLMCLRKILPDTEKQIKLDVTAEDIEECVEAVGIRPLSEMVLIHPGRGWPSKTFPAKWWNAVLDALIAQGLPVAVIGKDVSNEQGTVHVNIPEGVLDLRNLLSLGGLIALISQAKVLISNDSAPIHIAGAFDNQIILIPSCKHPDHVLPMRRGSRAHKSISMCKKLTSDAIDSNPTQKHGQTIDYVVGDIMEYLPDPADVAKVAKAAWDNERK